MGFSDILKYGYADGHIEDISIDKDDITVSFRQWNNNLLTFKFISCYRFKGDMPVGAEIGEVVVSETSKDLTEVKNIFLKIIRMKYWVC